MPQPKKQWVRAHQTATGPKVPDALKREVTAKANALVESELRSKHVEPPPEDPQFNYIEDIATKWFGHFFYFFSIYRSAGPFALGGTFESKFARLEYTGYARFNLAVPRHTGQWIEIFSDLTLDECLAAVRDDPWFQP